MKIKLRTRTRTIKLRDSKQSAPKVFRRYNFKTLIRRITPEKPKQETPESVAADSTTEIVESAVHRTMVVPKALRRRADPERRTSSKYCKTKKQASGAADSSAAPPVFTRTSQAEHPSMGKQGPFSAENTVSVLSDARRTISIKTKQVPASHTAAKTAPPKLPVHQFPQRPKAIGRRTQQRTVSQASKAVRANQAAQAAKARHAAKAAKTVNASKTTRRASQHVAAALKTAVRQIGTAVGSVFASLGSISVFLIPLLLVVLIGGLLISPLGLFFSTEVEGEMSLQQAMSQLNTEFSDRITEIENSVEHDEVQQNGQRAVWKEILTVYAVKTTTGAENSMDAVTMDEAHFAVLQEIFWDMNSVDYATEIYTEEVTVEIEDSSGEVSEETQTVEKTRLVITIGSKTAQQMAEEYGFTEEQLGYVAELLSEEYAEFWTMLSLTGGGSDDIVAVALSQVGNVGGEPYWSWYGYTSRVSWCACFVSWCGDQCGYLDAGILPKFSYCDSGIAWFQERGQWQGRDYIPSPGDIIFFDYDHNGSANHVGIVESCNGSTVYTIEGNASDAVKQLSYSVGYSGIMGYGVPAYP